MACEPETDLENAGQFSSIIPPGLHAAVQSYLLAKIRGGSMDVNEIMQEAKCYSHCIPPGLMPRIKTWLLCQLSNTGGETPIPPSPECDADAQAFITAAGLTDEIQIGAVCVLVRDLKAYPAAQPEGNRYWAREVAIYPFVGGTAASHLVNLKTPGTYNVVWNGAGLTHNNLGVKGDGTTSFGDTRLLVAAQNSFRTSYYIEQDSTTSPDRYFGATAPIWESFKNNTRFAINLNDAASNSSAINANNPGIKLTQRIDANTKQLCFGVNSWTSFAVASTGLASRYIYLLALNAAGVAPVGGVPSFHCDAQISSFSFGAPLDVGGGNTEYLEYKGIWDAFHITLGRGHP